MAVWDEQTQTQTTERIEQTPAALRAWIETLRARFGGAPIAVAIEQSRGAVFETLSAALIRNGALSISVEVIHGHAWSPSERRSRRAGDEVLVPLEALRARRKG